MSHKRGCGASPHAVSPRLVQTNSFRDDEGRRPGGSRRRCRPLRVRRGRTGHLSTRAGRRP
eukprot:6210435-Heterocapsa_arctica.AAC.1